MSSPNKNKNQTSSSQSNKRKISDSSDDECLPTKILNKSPDNFPKFIVLKSLNEEKPLTKISPFIIQKTIQSVAGEVKKVSKLKNGSILIECTRQKQSQNLLSLTTVLDIPIVASPHRTLNYCQGIIRDRDHDLSDMSEQEICEELKSQNITNVKRFTKKVDNNIIQLTTYLLTFEQPTAPSHIYLGPYRIKVDLYVPNPTRCFKCQKFGHGKSSCRGKEKCVKCSGEGHSNFECDGEVKCSNCGLNHMANSRNCEFYKKEMKIQKLKTEKNISYQEAKKQISASNDSTQSTSYADKVKGTPTTRTFETQTIFTWPNGYQLPILVSDFSPSKVSSTKSSSTNTSSSSQTPGNSQSSTVAKSANTKSINKSPGQSNSSSTKNDKPNGKSRSASAEKNKIHNSNRVRKAEKSLLFHNQYEVLSADDAGNEEMMDTSSNQQIESVWGNYPNRGRQTGRTRDGGRFTSCSPDTDERRNGKISPIRAPPK